MKKTKFIKYQSGKIAIKIVIVAALLSVGIISFVTYLTKLNQWIYNTQGIELNIPKNELVKKQC